MVCRSEPEEPPERFQVASSEVLDFPNWRRSPRVKVWFSLLNVPVSWAWREKESVVVRPILVWIRVLLVVAEGVVR